MRITGGIARSLKLKSPKGDFIRPSADSSRERLFSSLGDAVQGKTFLDLFAGTGACGLEALSRGAESGCFVEKNRRAAQCIRDNLQVVAKALGGPNGSCQVCLADALKWRPVSGSRFDLVFLNPPYAMIEMVTTRIFESIGKWISPQGLVIFEMPAGLDYKPDGWHEFRRLGKRGKGDPTQHFLRQA